MFAEAEDYVFEEQRSARRYDSADSDTGAGVGSAGRDEGEKEKKREKKELNTVTRMWWLASVQATNKSRERFASLGRC